MSTEEISPTEDDSNFDGIDPEFRLFRPKNVSVLLVDDDEEQLGLFSILLQRENFEVFTATSAEAGLKLLSRVHFDIVISDYQMPEVNGFQFVNKIQEAVKDLREDHLPIILLTACDESLEFPAMNIGVDMFCEKRNAKSSLVKQVKFLLGF